jgi:hypothetical protein
MPQSSKLLAWVEPQRDQEFLTAYVGGAAAKRRPATQLCASPDDARRWVEHEAAALGLTVAWVSEAPEGPGRFSRWTCSSSCHGPKVEAVYTIVPRRRGYWIEAVAQDGSRSVVQRYDTEDKAFQHPRMLQQRAERAARRGAPPATPGLFWGRISSFLTVSRN